MSFWETLKNEAKKEGLEVLEESAKLFGKALFRSISISASASTNNYLKMVVPVLPLIEPVVMEMLDKINPADNVPT